MMEANAGDKVCIPPDYGHITVNAGSENLVMANWVSEGCSSFYEPIKVVGVASCFVIEEDGKKQFVVNYKCKLSNPVRHLKA